MKKELLDLVLEQIARDVEAGDMIAIEELIADIPSDKAFHYLPEIDPDLVTSLFNLSDG